jgi:hypothetical protein
MNPPQDLLAYLAAKSAHSDVGAEMLSAAKELGEYRMVGDGASCKALALVTKNEPFAFVLGMHELHVRLGPALLKIALETGAQPSFAGDAWVQFVLFRADYPRFDLPFWLRKAYDHVRHP